MGGIRYLVFDKDNTLTLPYERELHPSVSPIFESIQEMYGPQNIAILSNSVGSKEDKGFKEADLIERKLGIKVIRQERKKTEV